MRPRDPVRELRQLLEFFPNAATIPSGDYRTTCAGCSVVEEGGVLPQPTWSPHLISGKCGEQPRYVAPPGSPRVLGRTTAGISSIDDLRRVAMDPSGAASTPSAEPTAPSGTASIPDTDLYLTLGVERDASAADVRKAYIRQATAWHPDRHSGSDETARAAAGGRFAVAAAAFDVLGDAEKRRSYDATGAVYHRGSPVLSCTHCMLPDGKLRKATIALATCGDDFITNIAGVLRCYDRPLPPNAEELPAGSFADACFGCAASGDVLSCSVCLDDFGDRHEALSAPLAGCASFGFELVGDEEGQLMCEEDAPELDGEAPR